MEKVSLTCKDNLGVHIHFIPETKRNQNVNRQKAKIN